MSADNKLPVIIAGAGPCGLTAALVLLQKQGVPFVIVERAERDHLCSDVGSGFDLAPTAIDILENRLGLDTTNVFQTYGGMHLQTMKDKTVRDISMKEMNIPYHFCSVTRSSLQNLLLDTLMKETTKHEDEILRCGVQVNEYKQQDDESIQVSLSDGASIVGSVLLGCDGIASAVRRHMFSDQEDKLHFCKTNCWWAKTEMTPELRTAVDKTQKFNEVSWHLLHVGDW